MCMYVYVHVCVDVQMHVCVFVHVCVWMCVDVCWGNNEYWIGVVLLLFFILIRMCFLMFCLNLLLGLHYRNKTFEC